MTVENKKIMKQGLVLVFIFLIIHNILLMIADIPTGANMGYDIYFTIQNSSRDIFYTIFLLALLPSLQLITYYDSFHNKHQELCILRIGNKKFYCHTLIKLFFFSFLFRLIIEVLFITNIHFFQSNIDFTNPVHTHPIFGEYAMKNLVIYILFTSIGTGIFSCFWFSLNYFIKNKYIYRGIMVLWLFLSMTIFSSLYGILGFFLGQGDKALSLATSITPISLLTPGVLYESYGFVNFTGGMILYSLATVVLIMITIRKKYQDG